MQERIKRPTANFQDDALDCVTEQLRLWELRDLGQELQSPPLSWTLAWRDHYSDRCPPEKEHGIGFWGHSFECSLLAAVPLILLIDVLISGQLSGFIV